MSTETNATVAQAATETDAIDLGGTLLLGVITTPEGARALLRHRSGKVETVAPGDKTRLGKVLAIDEGQLHLSAGKREVVLKLPQG